MERSKRRLSCSVATSDSPERLQNLRSFTKRACTTADDVPTYPSSQEFAALEYDADVSDTEHDDQIGPLESAHLHLVKKNKSVSDNQQEFRARNSQGQTHVTFPPDFDFLACMNVLQSLKEKDDQVQIQRNRKWKHRGEKLNLSEVDFEELEVSTTVGDSGSKYGFVDDCGDGSLLENLVISQQNGSTPFYGSRSSFCGDGNGKMMWSPDVSPIRHNSGSFGDD